MIVKGCRYLVLVVTLEVLGVDQCLGQVVYVALVESPIPGHRYSYGAFDLATSDYHEFSTDGFPLSIVADSTGSVYVSRSFESVIRKYDPKGMLLGTRSIPLWDGGGVPFDLAVGSQDELYVSAFQPYVMGVKPTAIVRFRSDGTYLGRFGPFTRGYSLSTDSAGNLAIMKQNQRGFGVNVQLFGNVQVYSATAELLRDEVFDIANPLQLDLVEFEIEPDGMGFVALMSSPYDAQVVRYDFTTDNSQLILATQGPEYLGAIAIGAQAEILVSGGMEDQRSGYISRYSISGEFLGNLVTGLPGITIDFAFAKPVPEPSGVTIATGLAIVASVRRSARAGERSLSCN